MNIFIIVYLVSHKVDFSVDVSSLKTSFAQILSNMSNGMWRDWKYVYKTIEAKISAELDVDNQL